MANGHTSRNKRSHSDAISATIVPSSQLLRNGLRWLRAQLAQLLLSKIATVAWRTSSLECSRSYCPIDKSECFWLQVAIHKVVLECFGFQEFPERETSHEFAVKPLL